MMKWLIEFVNETAEKEFMALDASFKARFLHIAELIERFGPFHVGMPHIRPLEDKLWEIRLKSNPGIARSIYVMAEKKKIIILHTFVKKTQKTPRAAFDKAKSRLKEIKK